MPVMSQRLLCLYLCLLPAIAAAENEAGSWIIASTTGVVQDGTQSSPWRFAADAQYRWVDDAGSFRQYLLRPSLGYTLPNGVQLWLGFGRFETFRFGRRVSVENRYWQQANWRLTSVRGGALSARLRIEERLFDTGDDTGVVARMMLRYTRPIEGVSGRYWTAAAEAFVDFADTDWGAREGVSQSRVILAIGQSINERLALEVGYMNQYFFRQSATDRSNHLLTLHAKVTF